MLRNYLLLMAVLTTAVLAKVPLSQKLLDSLQSKKTVNILVTLKNHPDAILHGLSTSTRQFSTRSDKIQSLTDSLQSHSWASQKNVLSYLNRVKPQKKGVKTEVTSLWISNQLAIKSADAALVNYLAEMEDVANIQQEEFFYINPVTHLANQQQEEGLLSNEVEWSIEKVGAPQAWALGYNGTGVKVATIDTGVRFSHESLRDNYAGAQYYGWYDAIDRTAEPNDQNGHGTHVTGILAGNKGIGVAPGTTWMSCKGCGTDECSSLALAECLQFMLCPTDTQGKNKNCSLAPQIISNSWAGGQGNTYFKPEIDALEAAGIIVLFGNGNAGPDCGTANSPADSPNVIAVGATNSRDQVAPFSSVGPAIGGLLKPDVSAPGQTIRSASNSRDDFYVRLSGTSMSCPNAAGVVALMLSKNPNLSVNQVRQYLTEGCEPTLCTRKNCGAIAEDMFPNHHAGFGRVNAVNSLARFSAG